MIGVIIAPPTTDITNNDEPNLVWSPRPRILNANMVGNIMDIKKKLAMTPTTPVQPPPTIANTIIKLLMAAYAASAFMETPGHSHHSAADQSSTRKQCKCQRLEVASSLVTQVIDVCHGIIDEKTKNAGLRGYIQKLGNHPKDKMRPFKGWLLGFAFHLSFDFLNGAQIRDFLKKQKSGARRSQQYLYPGRECIIFDCWH